MKLYEDALNDFQLIMEKEPNNAEVNADLKTARLHVEKAGGHKGFKKITIEEEEDDDSNNEEEVFLI